MKAVRSSCPLPDDGSRHGWPIRPTNPDATRCTSRVSQILQPRSRFLWLVEAAPYGVGTEESCIFWIREVVDGSARQRRWHDADGPAARAFPDSYPSSRQAASCAQLCNLGR